MQHKDIINPSLALFVLDIVEHVKAGWDINPDRLPAMWGIAHEVGMIREDVVQAHGVETPIVKSDSKSAKLTSKNVAH